MIKRSVLIVLSLVIILCMFVTTSSASFLFSRTTVYKNLHETSMLKQMYDRFLSEAASHTDEGYTSYEEDNVDVYLSEENQIIDVDGVDGQDQQIIEENWGVNTTNDEIVTDTEGNIGRNLERVIEIITGGNGTIGELLQRVIKRTYASSGGIETIIDGVVIAGSDLTTDNAEAVISNVVVVTDNSQT